MTTYVLSAFAGAGWQFLDNNGDILSGGFVYTYVAGTTANTKTWLNSTGGGANENSNPIVLDPAGRPPAEVWLDASLLYKFIVRDALGNLIRTYDNIPGILNDSNIGDILDNYVTLTGAQTISNKTVEGALDIYTEGLRIGITSDSSPLINKRALVHIQNLGSLTNGLLVESRWTGATGSPFNNNDDSLFEVLNTVSSNSENRSWGGSFANAYNSIGAGVTDTGERIGVYGWAVSAIKAGYVHAGTLTSQVGVDGRAGFLEVGGGVSGAVIGTARAVRGAIVNDVAGATIQNARAGEFSADAVIGTTERAIGLYSSASGGTIENWSFYGAAGKLFNLNQVQVRSTYTDANAFLSARDPGNAIEFGFPDLGYVGALGCSVSSGFPFLAFSAEAEASGNTFRTRGASKGVVISADLTGALIFSRVPLVNTTGQTPSESARFDPNGHLTFAVTPVLAAKTPASAAATGIAGEFCYDSSFLYACVATNTWKRVAISTW